MAFKIGTVDSLAPSRSIFETDSKSRAAGAIPFADYLKDALYRTNDLLLEADRLADDFAAGRTDNIHQVMLAGEKANIALQFTLQIRNKLLDAYTEIMRMQI
ncbi:MAG TPA: flagellar hook-basal body complex protein FliE [Clostridiales bacterium]|nr:flagellar hook-basal body complex protein FliE [Clostridiales bacterium]HPV02599.1 flagellar hook-basal body complex protein FliE [Clostridiales bacterium]